MSDAKKNNAEEDTLIKSYEELEKTKTPIRGAESFPLLEIVQGPKQGAWFTIAYQKEITLGRAATNSIILEDNSVSRTHAVLQSSGEGFTVRDIGSRNGTFLNGKKIQGEVPLNHGDTIKVGIYTLRFLTEPTEEVYEAKEEYTPRLQEDQTGTRLNVPSGAPEEEGGVSVGEEVSQGRAEAPSPTPEEPGEKIPAEDLGMIEAMGEEAKPGIPGVSPAPLGKKQALRSFRNLGILLGILLLLGGGTYSAYRLGALQRIKNYFASGKSPPVSGKKLPAPKVVKPAPPPAAEGEGLPIFLEADAPIPGKVFYKGKELGQTPFKINLQVPVGKLQEISAEFFLEGIQEKVGAKETFQVAKQDEMVSVHFKPPVGKLRVEALPKEGELYLEGKFEGAGAPAKSIKLENIAYDTPIYLPYGEYVAEIRVPETLTGSTSTVDTVKFRREFKITAEAPEFSIQAPEEALEQFPAKISSNPTGAELLVDGKKVGETPFDGPIPTGRHQLVIKKEGYAEVQKELSIELNTPYTANFNLGTSPAGEFANRGRELLKKGLYNEAIEQLAEALKRNPEPTELSQIHMLLGEAFIQSKTFDQALAYYQKAQDNPAYEKTAKLGEAEAYAGLGQTDQALIKILDVFLNTKDEKIKGQAESVYKSISPMKSVLYINTDPAGAQITVNGNPINQPTPVILSDLLVGSYRVGVTKPGYKPYETRVTVPISSIKPVIVKLEAQ